MGEIGTGNCDVHSCGCDDDRPDDRAERRREDLEDRLYAMREIADIRMTEIIELRRKLSGLQRAGVHVIAEMDEHGVTTEVSENLRGLLS